MFSWLVYFSFRISFFNPLMLTNLSNKLSSSWNFCSSSPYMHKFWESFSNLYWWSVMTPSLSDAWRRKKPSSVFARYLRVVPDVLMLFFALWLLAGGLGGLTWFIFPIIYCWDAIYWEGEMFHYLFGVKYCFGHFKFDCLEGFQGDTAGYWDIISGAHILWVCNAMWYVAVGWGIPGGLAVS